MENHENVFSNIFNTISDYTFQDLQREEQTYIHIQKLDL